MTAPASTLERPPAGHWRDETDAHPDLRVRRVRFDWADVPVHWLPDDPMAAQVMNVIHVLLPPGEAWFVDVYREVLPKVADERLRREVKAFMGQESVHGRTHQGVLDHFDALGYETHLLTEGFRREVEMWERLAKRLGGQWMLDRARLAAIAGVEHYTAVLGEWAVVTPVLDRADPRMADVLRWHGAEELEHKCVAFDLHQEISGGSYVFRVLGYVVASYELAKWFRISTDHLLDRDGVPRKGRRRAVLRSFRRRNLPGRELARSFLTYLRPDFHPSERPTLHLSRAYLDVSPAVAATRG